VTGASRRSEFLVDTAFLAGRLADPGIRVVDVRGVIRPPSDPAPSYLESRDKYAAAHIPGAAYVGWLTDLVEPAAPVKMTMASPERFAAVMGRLGIGDHHLVIAYDDDGNHLAARLWFMLNYYGHGAVRLLDGGYPKWAAEGRPLSADTPAHAPATFTPRIQPGWRVTAEEVHRALGVPSVRLVDSRTPAQYRGEITRGERHGRIPGAVNVPIERFWEGPYKTWRSAADLQAAHRAAGVTPESQVITYCNAGVSASVGLFALRMLGYQASSNYAGSWYDWERDPSNPIEKG
jgi:thiosulfate/3-mercaptopyruvate sulfurtransferase